MDQKTDRLYPTGPLEKSFHLEQKLEKHLNDVNSFTHHISYIKEMLTYFKYKNNKSKRNIKNINTNYNIKVI